jgi:hypothetical protein
MKIALPAEANALANKGGSGAFFVFLDLIAWVMKLDLSSLQLKTTTAIRTIGMPPGTTHGLRQSRVL